jgi:predicted metalloprotease
MNKMKFGAVALAMMGLMGTSPSSNQQVAYNAVAPGRSEGTLEVTNIDIAASNQKVKMAHAALADMWRQYFRSAGSTFIVPGLVRYRIAAGSSCGLMRKNNAGYCPADNNIYFDEVFLAAQAKAAGRELGTDGDMAAVGIIAHEMGHAVSIQLGFRSRSVYAMEATADCLAGAFTEHAEEVGSLEPGDIEEAFFGMASAGDPEPELTGDARLDRRILRVASRMGHGTREQRTQNFRRGLEGGANACLDESPG